MRKQDMAIEGIIKKGWVEIKSSSKKYRKFSHPKRDGIFCFVGTKGALRIGKNIALSTSLTDFFLKKTEVVAETSFVQEKGE